MINHKKVTFAFAFAVVVLFAVYGMFITGIVLHELNHARHARTYSPTVQNDRIEVYLVPFGPSDDGAAGRYFYSSSESIPDNEFQAYTVTTIIFLIVMFSLFLMLLYYYDHRDATARGFSNFHRAVVGR